MKAAVVNKLGAPPSFEDFREPVADEGESVVKVNATALSPIVKMLASGKHYTSDVNVGFIPGVDGVGVDASGQRVYFLFPKAPFGSMAEQSLVSNHMMVPVPDELPDLYAASIATAGLASWIALTRRAQVQKGETVMVLGATGSAGGMALDIARYLGAGKIIAVGRNEKKLQSLNADVKVALNDGSEAALREQFNQRVDIVLDFLWGEPAVHVLRAATMNRGSGAGEPRLRYVQLGTVAGDEVPIRGDMLRSSGLELIGSGIGSVAVNELIQGAGELLAAAPAAGFHAPHKSLPLSAVAEAWVGDASVRYILTPDS